MANRVAHGVSLLLVSSLCLVHVVLGRTEPHYRHSPAPYRPTLPFPHQEHTPPTPPQDYYENVNGFNPNHNGKEDSHAVSANSAPWPRQADSRVQSTSPTPHHHSSAPHHHSFAPYRPTLPFPHQEHTPHPPTPPQDYYENVNGKEDSHTVSFNSAPWRRQADSRVQSTGPTPHHHSSAPYRPTLPFPHQEHTPHPPTSPQDYYENVNGKEDSHAMGANSAPGSLGPQADSRFQSPVTYPTPPIPTARLQSVPEVQQQAATESEPACGVLHSYKNSIPAGKLDSLEVVPLLADTAQECLSKCCDMGPKGCQYIMVYKKSCFSVSCPPERVDLCEPRFVAAEQDTEGTSYYEIVHPLVHNLQEAFREELEAAATLAPMDVGIEGNPTRQPASEGGPGQTGGTGFPTEATTTSTEASTEVITTTPEVTQTQPITTQETVSTETTVTPPTLTTDTTATPPTLTTDTTATPPTLTTDTTATPPTLTTDTTATPPTLTEPSLENLTIAIAGETKVVLPDNQVQLFASCWPNPPGVTYHWNRVFGPKEGILSGMNDATVTLSELFPGVYGLRVSARAPSGQIGEKYVNVTVYEQPRENTPPVPIISPSTNYTVDLPQETVIFDASESQDDLGPENLQFLWEQMTGPIDTGRESHQALLTLNNPQPGKYQYKLTVTDSDGLSAEAYVDLTVVPERDYPPLANAGSDVILKLPNSEIVLNGNGSTDDKPGLSYLWELLSDQTGIDMEGSDTPSLHISKLTLGVYHFKLTVTDSTEQSDSSEVTVDVLSEMNEPPVADAGEPYSLHFPDTSITLDGSHSHDDYENGMRFTWIQTSGPSDVVLSGANTSKLTVSGLHIDPAQGSPTTFTFNLTIQDYANLSSTDTAVLEYYKDPKILPHVSAGPDITITLPQDMAIVNGSDTRDDFGITSYQWSRSDKSPAAGIPLLGSDSKPVLILSDLVNGTYNFTLRVTNGQGVKAADSMTLHVLANPNDHYIIQLHLDTRISNFTQADMRDLGKFLSLTLDDYTIQFQGVYERHPHTVVEFYAIDTTTTDTFMNVSDAWHKLTENGQDYTILKYHIVQVEMKECQLSCSGHGVCDKKTKRCKCDMFWMENPFAASTGRKESNCNWSVFYVVLIVLGMLVAVGVCFWLACWCCLKRKRLSRTKRRIRYAIHDHNEDGESKRMLTKERLGQQHTSLMHSESETEEEVLFDSSRKQRTDSPQLKNNKLNSEQRYGKNSSLVNTVIPK